MRPSRRAERPGLPRKSLRPETATINNAGAAARAKAKGPRSRRRKRLRMAEHLNARERHRGFNAIAALKPWRRRRINSLSGSLFRFKTGLLSGCIV